MLSLRSALAVATLAAGAGQAQDFVLDLNFDPPAAGQTGAPVGGEALEFDTSSLEVPGIVEPAGLGPALSVRLGWDALWLKRASERQRSLAFRAEHSQPAGALGQLDWGANLVLERQGRHTAPRTELVRFVLQNSSGDLSWRLGKYRIGWGEIEGAPVLDVVNPDASSAAFGTDSDSLPGQWFAGAEVFANAVTVAVFVGLDPEVAHLLPAAPGHRRKEIGVKADIATATGQLSLYAARLVPQAGVVDVASMASHARPYGLAGVSGHRVAGPVLMEFDLAYKADLQRAAAGGLLRRDRVDAAAGVEYAVSPTAQLSASLTAQYWLGHDRAFFDFVPSGAVRSGRVEGAYLLGYEDSLLNERLGLTAAIGGALHGDHTFGALSIDYSLSDNLKLELSATYTRAAAGSLAAASNGARRLSASVEWFF